MESGALYTAGGKSLTLLTLLTKPLPRRSTRYANLPARVPPKAPKRCYGVPVMVTRVAPDLSPRGVRQRRWRLRQKPPARARAVYLVEFERDAVRQALINRSDLSANEIADRDCIARALSGVIAEWVEHERRRYHP